MVTILFCRYFCIIRIYNYFQLAMKELSARIAKRSVSASTRAHAKVLMERAFAKKHGCRQHATKVQHSAIQWHFLQLWITKEAFLETFEDALSFYKTKSKIIFDWNVVWSYEWKKCNRYLCLFTYTGGPIVKEFLDVAVTKATNVTVFCKVQGVPPPDVAFEIKYIWFCRFIIPTIGSIWHHEIIN